MPGLRWIEPSERLPLRWGTYRGRLVTGLLLLVGSGVAIAGSNTYQLLLLLAGMAGHLAGWTILPAEGWRRLVVAGPSTLACLLLLAGPQFTGVAVVPYLAWLLVRQRPPLSWLTIVFPIAAATLIGSVVTQYEGMLATVGVLAAVLGTSAWAARGIHVALRPAASG